MADVHIAGDNHPIDRRIDGGALKVDSGFVDRRFARAHDRLGLMKICNGFIQIGRRDQVAQTLIAFVGQCGVFQRSFRICQLRLSLRHILLVRRRINLRNQLPVRYVGIKVNVQLFDDAGNLAADLHVFNRIDLAIRSDALHQVSFRRRRGAILDLRVAALRIKAPARARSGNCHQGDHPL